MKIITINVPDMFIDYFQCLLDIGLYPSRSEAIRVAIRRFIFDELKMSKKLLEENNRIREEYKNTMNGNHQMVCIPIDDNNVKIRKILRVLE